MLRKDWEAQVWDSNLNVTARCIALVVGTFGNYKDDVTLSASVVTIADRAGVSREAATRYIKAFVEQGWLVPVGTGMKNVTIYELGVPVADATGKLAKTKRATSAVQRSNIKHQLPTVSATTATNESDQLSVVPATSSDSVADTNSASCRQQDGQLPTVSIPVADSTDTIKDNNSLEQEEQVSNSADAPLPNSSNSRVKESSTVVSTAPQAAVGRPTPNSLDKELVLITNKDVRKHFLDALTRGTPEQVAEAAHLYRTHKVSGYGWMEQADNALEKAGIVCDVW